MMSGLNGCANPVKAGWVSKIIQKNKKMSEATNISTSVNNKGYIMASGESLSPLTRFGFQQQQHQNKLKNPLGFLCPHLSK